MRKDSLPLAIAYSLSAALCYAILAYLIKMTEQYLSNPMIIFFRQVFSFILIMPLIPFQIGSYKKLKTKCFHLHLLRAFASLAAMFCLYFALRFLPLVDAVLLTYTRPLFIPIVVYFWFQKKWTKNTWWGLLIGFLGVLIILRPDEKIFDIASLVGLGGGMFGSIAFTAIRRLTRSEPSERILFYFLALSLPIAAVPLATKWITPSLYEWGLLFVIGVTATIYQMLLTRAYRHAQAFKIGSLLYSSVVFAWFFDWLTGSKGIGITEIIGIILVAFGSFTALREQKG